MFSFLGQYFAIGLSGTSLTKEEKEAIKKFQFAGIILFSKNYESKKQLTQLCQEIQSYYLQEFPCLIMTDQEGGRVQRFKQEFTLIPSLLNLSQTISPKEIFEIFFKASEELKSCGIVMNLAPCLDVVISYETNKAIGDRSLGGDTQKVKSYGTAIVRAIEESGLFSCSKHFPGHGRTSLDSHEELPIVDVSLTELEKSDLLPFVGAIKARTSAIMMSHLLYKRQDPNFPVSLSPFWHQYLRKTLKFKGLILTDDFEMKAITDTIGTSQATVAALKAGTDIVLFRSLETFLTDFVKIEAPLRSLLSGKTALHQQASFWKNSYLKR